MSILGIIIIWVFVAVAFVISNHGPKDKELKRRKILWAKFEGK